MVTAFEELYCHLLLKDGLRYLWFNDMFVNDGIMWVYKENLSSFKLIKKMNKKQKKKESKTVWKLNIFGGW